MLVTSVVTTTDLRLTLLGKVIFTYRSIPRSLLRTIIKVMCSVRTSVVNVFKLFRMGTITWSVPKKAGTAEKTYLFVRSVV